MNCRDRRPGTRSSRNKNTSAPPVREIFPWMHTETASGAEASRRDALRYGTAKDRALTKARLRLDLMSEAKVLIP